MTSKDEITFMRRALRLAERGRGRTSPNPPVGAVVVSHGEVVGEGWHKGPGLAHAEVEALAAAGERARGATLFVTLAPCTRDGRTPACAPQVLRSGIGAIVVATKDPNPNEPADPFTAFTDAGIRVTVGVEEEAARNLIRGFTQRVTTGRPLVTVKIASTLDGKVAAADGTSRWITGPTARRDGHRLRGWSDAVMVGIGTVLTDDPRLTCRLRGFDGRQPLRVVLDSCARIPVDAAVLGPEAQTLLVTTAKATDESLDPIRARGAEVVRVPARDGRVDVAAVLDELGRRGMNDVLVEGGPTLVGEIVERGFADRYVIYLAPKLIGQAGLGSIAGLLVPNIADARELTIVSVRRVGADVRIEARPRI